MEPEIYCQMREVEDSHWWFDARRAIIAAVLSTLDLPPMARILDVGSGTGGNLDMLSHFGAVTAIESDEMAIKLCSSRESATVHKGSLPGDLPTFPYLFDLITLFDVLEHIDDDVAAMKSLARLLAPHGSVLITVPAFPFLWGDHDIHHHHKRRYRYSTLNSILRESSFRICHMTYYNTWLFPFIVAVRIFRKFIPSGIHGRDVRIPSPMVNRILKVLFASERFLVTRFRLPFGISLIAVSQKGGISH